MAAIHSQSLELPLIFERHEFCTIFGNSLRRSHASGIRWFEVGAKLKIPSFLVESEPRYVGMQDSLKVLCTRNLRASRHYSYLFHRSLLRRPRKNRFSLGTSTAVHAAMLMLLIYVPEIVPANEYARNSSPVESKKIYYRVSLDSPKHLPRIAPRGTGAKPGSGTFALSFPDMGSAAESHNLTIVSKPKVPDNSRQTIIQPLSPPDLKIKTDIKLPNIILGNQPEALKPKVNLDGSNVKPNQVNRQVKPEMAPIITSRNPDPIIPNLRDIPTSRPHLPVAFGDPIHPLAGVIKNENAAPSTSPLAMSGDQSGLTVLGIDPADSAAQLALPPGNRLGDFTISDAGAQPGSPGGTENSHVPGGNGDPGIGGDGSVGVGAGFEGGGGGASGALGNFSVNGGNGSAGEPTSMRTGSPADLVYPVVSAAMLALRKNALVISAGPLGGGGLDVYRALYCGKIYTVFLPMPGKNWSMQYCQSSGRKESNDPRGAVVHMETSVTPPDPDLSSRFDFKRLPVPIDKARKMIVLKGILREDGTIDKLEIYQSVLPAMDEAARTAFGHWKFKPALRGGAPVAVDILVGIPAEIVPNRVAR